MGEASVVKRTMVQASKLGNRLFRNNRGFFYTLDKKRQVRAGLEAVGASDLIGIAPLVITPEMVGMTVGLFMAAECKEENWKAPSNDHENDQLNFIQQICKLGGIGFFIKNHEDLADKIADCIAEKIFKNKLDSGLIEE